MCRASWTLGLAGAWGVGYFIAPRWSSGTAAAFDPALPWDARLPCVPGLLWVYLLGVLLPLLPAWLIRGEAFLRTARAYALLIATSTAAFVLLPTDAGPLRAACYEPGMLNALFAIDMRSNLLPSLHVGLATLAALCLRSAGSRWSGALIIGALLQAAAACLVKQHYLVDTVAGAALACIVHALAFWRSPSTPAPIQPSSCK